MAKKIATISTKFGSIYIFDNASITLDREVSKVAQLTFLDSGIPGLIGPSITVNSIDIIKQEIKEVKEQAFNFSKHNLTSKL